MAASSSSKSQGFGEETKGTELRKTELPLKEVEMNEIEEWPEKDVFRSAVECPVCFSVPFGEIRLCSRGHHVCKYCLEKLFGERDKKCPICKESYNSRCTRSFALEELVGKGTFSCPRGCNEVRKGALMAAHIEDECEQREVICLFCSVEDQGTKHWFKVLEFINHLMTHHDVQGCSQDDASYEFQRLLTIKIDSKPMNYVFLPAILRFDGEFFLFRFQCKSVGGQGMLQLSMWVQVVGAMEEAKDYRSIITLKKKESKMSFNIPVSSIREKIPMERDVACFILDYQDDVRSHMEGLRFDEGYLNMRIRIETDVLMIRKDGKTNTRPAKIFNTGDQV